MAQPVHFAELAPQISVFFTETAALSLRATFIDALPGGRLAEGERLTVDRATKTARLFVPTFAQP